MGVGKGHSGRRIRQKFKQERSLIKAVNTKGRYLAGWEEKVHTSNGEEGQGAGREGGKEWGNTRTQ